jgi:hypothetical protein
MNAPKYKLQIVQNDPTNHYPSQWIMVRIADDKPVAQFVADVPVAQKHLAQANGR